MAAEAEISKQRALPWVIVLLSLAGLRLYVEGALTLSSLMLLAGPIAFTVRTQLRAHTLTPEAAGEAFHGAVFSAVMVFMSVVLLV
jgi:hypothetical protein